MCDWLRSMDQEDELLSLAVVKGARKLVAGTQVGDSAWSCFHSHGLLSISWWYFGLVMAWQQSGVLLIYNWNEWANCSDRFVGHPETVETLVKIDEVSNFSSTQASGSDAEGNAETPSVVIYDRRRC